MLQLHKYSLHELNFQWSISLHIYYFDYDTATVLRVLLQVYWTVLLYFEIMEPVFTTWSNKWEEVSCDSPTISDNPGSQFLSHICSPMMYLTIGHVIQSKFCLIPTILWLRWAKFKNAFFSEWIKNGGFGNVTQSFSCSTVSNLVYLSYNVLLQHWYMGG